MRDWTIRDSLELYGVSNWGSGFFDINANGNLEVLPRGNDRSRIDMRELVRDLEQRGVRTPMLIRFSDILAARIQSLGDSFQRAIDRYGYRGAYRGVYPIKVNQQRQVLEEIVQFGASVGVGLEAGSKPELLVALAMLDTPDALIICNGYKDRAYVETALLAQRLGRVPVVVVDRYSEIDLVIKVSRELSIRPHLGLRARLSTRGAGRWVDSTGDRSKFGLSSIEMVDAIERLREADMLDCVELLHFHIGSQITAAKAHKDALAEGSRIFVGLHEMGATPRLIDVGGGLGVDYDGSRTDSHSSKNYSMQEYANDVVAWIGECCDEANVPHPDIVTESGRAMVAHHSVLIFDVLGVQEMSGTGPRDRSSRRDDDAASEGTPAKKILRELANISGSISRETLQKSYHDVLHLRHEASTLFSLGNLDLRGRARADELFFHCCQKILQVVRDLPSVPEDLEDLERSLADIYYGNFSVFQSAPDHWAVKQLFPVMPIHRLDERPTRRGVFADLTCDSDGKIDQFIDRSDAKEVLELHAWNGSPYYVALFLVGAYQEILGDLHNLFGDTDAVHVKLDDLQLDNPQLDKQGGYVVEHIVRGDSIEDVLEYVQYDRRGLIDRVRAIIERAKTSGQITARESEQLLERYEQALEGYTYLSSDL